MFIAKVEDGVVVKYPVDVAQECPDGVLPAGYVYVVVDEEPPITVNTCNQALTPVLEDGVWTQHWASVPATYTF